MINNILCWGEKGVKLGKCLRRSIKIYTQFDESVALTKNLLYFLSNKHLRAYVPIHFYLLKLNTVLSYFEIPHK